LRQPEAGAGRQKYPPRLGINDGSIQAVSAEQNLGAAQLAGLDEGADQRIRRAEEHEIQLEAFENLNLLRWFLHWPTRQKRSLTTGARFKRLKP
jgi:hypothetical protein